MIAALALAVAAREPTVTLMAVGDIMLDRYVGRRLGKGIDPLKSLRAYLSKPDILIGNLECPITTAPRKGGKRFVFRVDRDKAGFLRQFTALSVANNHTLDCGVSGLADTVSFLRQTKVRAFGRSEAGTPKVEYLQRNGIKFALLGYSDFDQGEKGIALWNGDNILRAVIEAKRQSDWVIVMPHWGNEHTETVNTRQKAQAIALRRAGADLILGSHPHVVQWDQKDPTIIYSLGNFIFDATGSDRNSIIVSFVVTKHRIIPTTWKHIQILNGFPQAATAAR